MYLVLLTCQGVMVNSTGTFCSAFDPSRYALILDLYHLLRDGPVLHVHYKVDVCGAF